MFSWLQAYLLERLC